MKHFFYLISFFIVLAGILHAELRYSQEMAICTFASEEDTKENVSQWLLAAAGDPNLKVMRIEYKNEKIGKDCIAYKAILTCFVSEPDVDIARVAKKMADNNPNIGKCKVWDFKEPSQP